VLASELQPVKPLRSARQLIQYLRLRIVHRVLQCGCAGNLTAPGEVDVLPCHGLILKLSITIYQGEYMGLLLTLSTPSGLRY